MNRGLQTVLAAALILALTATAQAAIILVDNTDPEAAFTGTWPTSTYSAERIGPNYQHSNHTQGMTATYTPTLTAGFWKVEAFWNASVNRGDDVPYTVTYDGGVSTVNWDQRSDGNQWNDLGIYQFADGTAGNVEISSTVSNSEYVVADAIRFTEVPDPSRLTVLNAVADAFIQGNDSQHGGDSLVQVKNEGVTLSWSRKGYMRFDLSPLTFDHTTGLGSATLTLNSVESSVGTETDNETYEFEVFGLLDGDPGENWAENSIVWSNAPANDTASHDGMLANATSLGTFTLDGKGIGELNFSTEGLTDFVAASTADDLVTLMIVRHTPQGGPGGVGDNYAHAFASLENGQFAGPQLTLEQAVPEPATWLLAVLGMLGLFWVARRRPSAPASR